MKLQVETHIYIREKNFSLSLSSTQKGFFLINVQRIDMKKGVVTKVVTKRKVQLKKGAFLRGTHGEP